jgi:hypothetical protein
VCRSLKLPKTEEMKRIWTIRSRGTHVDRSLAPGEGEGGVLKLSKPEESKWLGVVDLQENTRH